MNTGIFGKRWLRHITYGLLIIIAMFINLMACLHFKPSIELCLLSITLTPLLTGFACQFFDDHYVNRPASPED